MDELPSKKPLAIAGLWGIGVGVLGAVVAPALAACPQLQDNWPFLLYTGAAAAVAKYVHSGRSVPIVTILDIVRRLVEKESPNAAAVVVQAAPVAEVKAQVEQAVKDSVKLST